MVRVLLILKHTGSQGLRGLQDSQGSLGLQDTLSLILTPTRLTICPGSTAMSWPVGRNVPVMLSFWRSLDNSQKNLSRWSEDLHLFIYFLDITYWSTV